MAMTKQTTKCDGKARLRSSVASAFAIAQALTCQFACSIADGGIDVSKAFSTVPDSTFGTNKENSLSCILPFAP
jgi:hypothetical protein